MTVEDLESSVRSVLKKAGTLREVKMFGGIGFMLNGNLTAAASRRGLLLRVGDDRMSGALAQRGARPMVMKGRTMKDYIYVDPAALNDSVVRSLLKLAIEFVQTLPPKKSAAKRKPAKGK
jgi:TfoX/Sxy family transcriptional regulator of competence genes